MITFQVDSESKYLIMFFDNKGIDEMINMLQFIKSKDASMHLVSGIELDVEAIDEDLRVIEHAKMLNVDKLDRDSTGHSA